MLSRRRVLLLVALVMIVAALGVRRFHRAPLTQRDPIRALLLEAKQAVESKSVRRLMTCVSRDYSDSHGNTYRTLLRTAADYARGQERVELTLNDPSIRVEGGGAVVTARVQIAIFSQSFPEPQTSVHSITLVLRKEGSRWKIGQAEGWEDVAPD